MVPISKIILQNISFFMPVGQAANQFALAEKRTGPLNLILRRGQKISQFWSPVEGNC
jgi:hypothetical protein